MAPDGIPTKLIQALCKTFKEEVQKAINKAFTGKSVPDSWRINRMSVLNR